MGRPRWGPKRYRSRNRATSAWASGIWAAYIAEACGCPPSRITGERGCDLVQGRLRLGGIAAPFRQYQERHSLVAKAHCPVERHKLARVFRQRRAVGRDRLLQPRRPALARTQRQERAAEVVLRHGPVERHPFGRVFPQRRAVSRDRLLQPPRPALARAKRPQRGAEVVLRHGPVERRPLGRAFGQRRAVGRHRLLQPRRPALAFPQRPERAAEVVLRLGPVERRLVACECR